LILPSQPQALICARSWQTYSNRIEALSIVGRDVWTRNADLQLPRHPRRFVFGQHIPHGVGLDLLFLDGEVLKLRKGIKRNKVGKVGDPHLDRQWVWLIKWLDQSDVRSHARMRSIPKKGLRYFVRLPHRHLPGVRGAGLMAFSDGTFIGLLKLVLVMRSGGKE